MMILLGSRAAILRAPASIRRKPVDFDWCCTREEYEAWMEKNADKLKITKQYSLNDGQKIIVEGNTNCEFEIVTPGTSSEQLYQLVHQDKDSFKTAFGMVPSFDMLFTLKTSHRYLKNSPYFWKTFADWHTMRGMGAKVRAEYQDFLKLREKETYAEQKHPSLMQDKKDFFSNDQINYIFDHDSIHASQKFFERPAYTYYAKDDQPVFSDKNKFFSCPKYLQMAGAIEEVSTLAIERSVVPHAGALTHKQAWIFSFSKVASSVTSGWFRQFVYENGVDIIKCYPENYVEKFQYGLEKGIVRYA